MSETFPAMGSSTPERGVARRYLRARQVYPATGASPIQDGAVLLDGVGGVGAVGDVPFGNWPPFGSCPMPPPGN